MNNNWMDVRKCPACGEEHYESKGRLSGEGYRFGNRLIEFPKDGVEIASCQVCTLAYKKTVPTKGFLSEVFVSQAGNIWNSEYLFEAERNLILRYMDSDSFDLMDIGPSNGGLLKALSLDEGRRSGLDVVAHPGIEKYIKGQFVCGLLDDAEIPSSHMPYDLVTAFDVFEHLYNPAHAFENLALLLKTHGILIVETGDIASYWPKKFGVDKWWYVNCFEHHVFWSRSSIEWIANNYGYEILSFLNKANKLRAQDVVRRKMMYLIQSMVYFLMPSIYKFASRVLRDNKIQPFNNFSKDHIQVVLRKNK